MFKHPSSKKCFVSAQSKIQLLNEFGWEAHENIDEGTVLLTLLLPSNTVFKIDLSNHQYITLDEYLPKRIGRMTIEEYEMMLLSKDWYWTGGRNVIDIREDYDYIQKKTYELCKAYRAWRREKRAETNYYTRYWRF